MASRRDEARTVGRDHRARAAEYDGRPSPSRGASRSRNPALSKRHRPVVVVTGGRQPAIASPRPARSADSCTNTRYPRPPSCRDDRSNFVESLEAAARSSRTVTWRASCGIRPYHSDENQGDCARGRPRRSHVADTHEPDQGVRRRSRELLVKTLRVAPAECSATHASSANRSVVKLVPGLATL